jgi:SAM-dependent methyltransferase
MLLADALGGGSPILVVERDDGYVEVDPAAVRRYFSSIAAWPPSQRAAMAHMAGRVLDVGCGAGRVALHAQEEGHEVVAIDSSPLAVQVARSRGVRDVRQMAFEDLDSSIGTIDTVVMLDAGFGLFGSAARARNMLARLHELTSTNGRIVAEVLDPYRTQNAIHLAYQAINRRRGLMPGHTRMRIRYRACATPWFDWLFASRAEVESIVEDTGWRLAKGQSHSALFTAVLDRAA